MTRQRIPDDVLDAAHARARARATRDWPEADRLKGEIEAAGWRIVDHGTDFALSPAAALDVAEGDRVRYGSSASVPSRFDDPPVGFATVVLVAADEGEVVARALAGLAAWSPAGTSVVIVADGPSAARDAALDAIEAAAAGPDEPRLPTEVVRTSEPLGRAVALNVGLRRSVGPVVIVLGPTVEPTGDLVTPLVRALDDPAVAIAGGWGMATRDLRRFEVAPPGEVDAVEGSVMAFRRADAAERGPLDEGFRSDRYLDVWWSLVLRDGGEGGPHRGALGLADLPVVRHEPEGSTLPPDSERERQAKRNFYRVIDRFGSRRDLARGRG